MGDEFFSSRRFALFVQLFEELHALLQGLLARTQARQEDFVEQAEAYLAKHGGREGESLSKSKQLGVALFSVSDKIDQLSEQAKQKEAHIRALEKQRSECEKVIESLEQEIKSAR